MVHTMRYRGGWAMTMVKEKHRKLETVPEDRRGSLLHRSIVCGKSNGNLGEMKREIIVDDSLFISPLLLSILARFLSSSFLQRNAETPETRVRIFSAIETFLLVKSS